MYSPITDWPATPWLWFSMPQGCRPWKWSVRLLSVDGSAVSVMRGTFALGGLSVDGSAVSVMRGTFALGGH